MKKSIKVIAVVSLLFPALFSACTATVRTQTPPPNRVEVIPAAPSARHVWIPGHYVRRGRNYGWVNGHYQLAPARYTAWEPGYWRQAPNGPVWVEGHWR